jgi:hypothetical protein
MLREVQQQHKSYLQTGVDAVVDMTFGADSTVGKEVSRYAPAFLTTAALFTPGRKALAASLLLGASNEMRVGDSLQMQIAEFGMGATKGVATKALFNKLGNANIMEGSLMSVPAKGVFLGASSRALDIGLTPQTWLNKSGGVDFSSGLEKTVAGSINPTSLAMDATIFSLAHGGTFGLNKITGGVIERSPALRNIVMGTTFGTTSGTTQEYMRQKEAGGPISWTEIAKRGLIQGALDGLASAPGAALGDPTLRSKLFQPSEKMRATSNLVTALSIGAIELTAGAHTSATRGSSAESQLLNKTTATSDYTVDHAAKTEVANGSGGGTEVAGGERITYDYDKNTATIHYDALPAERAAAPFIETSKNVNFVLTETIPRAKVVDSSGVVSGKGTVEVYGSSSDVELWAPAGQTLRVVIQEGSPKLRIADGNQGTIEVVNHTNNSISPELITDATGKPRENVRVLDQLSEIFSPAEIQRIQDVQAQQRALPKGQLLEHVQADIEALPVEERAAAIERRNAAEAKINELVNKAWGKGPTGTEKVIHIVIGPPGAGKSSLLVDPLVEKYGALLIDSDHIKPFMDGYANGLGTNAVHADSAEVAKRLLDRGYAEEKPMVYAQLGRVDSSMEQLLVRSKAEGYKTALHIADLPQDVSSRRVFDRSELPPDSRGIRQMVDPAFALLVAGRNPIRVFEKMIATPGLVDEYSHYDTNVPLAERARLIKASHTPPWLPPSPGAAAPGS